jgi:hypothetical protein
LGGDVSGRLHDSFRRAGRPGSRDDLAGPVRAPAVRAERFEVVDKTGRVLARIHARADGAVFARASPMAARRRRAPPAGDAAIGEAAGDDGRGWRRG